MVCLKRFCVFLVTVSMISACHFVPGSEVKKEERGAGNLSLFHAAKFPLGNTPVSVLAYDHKEEVVSYGGEMSTRIYTFWVELAVRNQAYDKSVGILFTKDDWKTNEKVYASYVEPLDGEFEKWRLEVTLGVFNTVNPPPDEVEFAAFAEMQGKTYWDPYDNYYVYKSVTPKKPVRLLNSALSYIPQTGIGLSGTVRVYDFAYEKKITVVYSMDNWITTREVQATYSSKDDWSFDMQGLGRSGALPKDVKFYIRYHVAGKEYFNGSKAQPYVKPIAPVMVINDEQRMVDDPEDWILSGVYSAYCSWNYDLGGKRYSVLLDGQDISKSGVLVFSTKELNEHPHSLLCVAHRADGSELKQAFSFTTENKLNPQKRWQPNYQEGDFSEWESAKTLVDSAGRVYIKSQRLLRFEGYESSLPATAFEDLPNGQHIDGFCLNSQEQVVGMKGKRLYRWTDSGRLDHSFGKDGIAELPIDSGGQRLRQIACGGQYMWFSVYSIWDNQSGILRVSEDAKQVDFLKIPYGGIYYDKNSLWLVNSSSLVQIQGDSTEQLRVVNSYDLPLSMRKYSTRNARLTRLPSGVFVALVDETRAIQEYSELVAFTLEGKVVSRWQIGSFTNEYLGYDYLGSLDDPSSIFLVNDQYFMVTDKADGSMTLFELH